MWAQAEARTLMYKDTDTKTITEGLVFRRFAGRGTDSQTQSWTKETL